MQIRLIIAICWTTSCIAGNVDSSLFLKKTISGSLSPKSVVHNGSGIFFAQNMMYRHTVTVYDRSYEKIGTIKDGLNPADFGLVQYDFSVKGGPVECAFSHNGKYAWVSNYSISGGDSTQFIHPGCDNCSGTGKYDSSFIYKINAITQKIEAVIQVGAVPKYVATSPDDKWVLVTNWSSGDLSIIDANKCLEVKRIKLGTFPRGIVVDHSSRYAYATVMGSTKLARIDLTDFSTSFIHDIGKGPRHLCISPDDKWLYLTLNSENKIARINLSTWGVEKLKVGNQPRSMTLSKDGKYLYLVNYNDNTFSKISASTFEVLAITKTKTHPIGITYDDQKKEVWVACYSGFLQVFKDSLVPMEEEIKIDGSIQIDQLALDGSAKPSVAQLSEVKNAVIDTIDVEDELVSVMQESNSSREMLPIRRMYLDFGKTFDFKKVMVEQVVSEVITEETTKTIAKDSQYLDHSKEFLVIVGSFGEPNNALNMIGIMADKGISADHFKHPSKALNYVYVYAADSLADAQSWATSNVPGDVEYWVMHQ
ncbi:MAG: YncE family protein [Flavobacteriales bacterium]|nr:YncE family protein [Flavobacteriales bacterium]